MCAEKYKWESYIKDLPDSPLIKETWEKDFVQAVFKNISKADKVLEVGCSNGRWLRWFHKQYRSDVYGVDNDSAGFKQDNIIKFKLGNAKQLSYEDESFDLVFSMGLVEHFNKKDKLQILKEQIRVLKKGGYLICQAPLLSLSLNYIYMKIAYDLRKGTKHLRTTKRELNNYLKELNLKILFSQPTGCLRETTLFKKIRRIRIFNKLFATEILIIGQKR